MREREAHGPFVSLKDFIERLSGKEVNKRTVENFIKSGAMDGLHATRRQLMMVYVQIMDQVNQERKKSMTGQMSLFDFVSEEDKAEFDVRYPNVGEYDKELKLAFEKEVLGILYQRTSAGGVCPVPDKKCTAVSSDFYVEERTEEARVKDNERVTIGGMITSKSVKSTKNNQLMAYITMEDLVGAVEVIIFPRDYERYQKYLSVDQKVYIRGRVSALEEQQAKLICENMIPFDEVTKEIWIKFDSKEAYMQREQELYGMLDGEDGNDGLLFSVPERGLSKDWEIVMRCREIRGLSECSAMPLARKM